METILTAVGIAVIFYLVREGWRAWADPGVILDRQAANMNWISARHVKKMITVICAFNEMAWR